MTIFEIIYVIVFIILYFIIEPYLYHRKNISIFNDDSHSNRTAGKTIVFMFWPLSLIVLIIAIVAITFFTIAEFINLCFDKLWAPKEIKSK